jgi:uncharacterized protein (DUF849 family)
VGTPEVVATGVVTAFDAGAAWFHVAIDRPSDASDVSVPPASVRMSTLTGTQTLVPGQRVECVRTMRSWVWGAVRQEVLQWRIAEQPPGVDL